MGLGMSVSLSQHPWGLAAVLGTAALTTAALTTVFAEQQRDYFSGANESLGWAVIGASFSSKERMGAAGCTCTGNGTFRAGWHS